jgi:hypothetical protein
MFLPSSQLLKRWFIANDFKPLNQFIQFIPADTGLPNQTIFRCAIQSSRAELPAWRKPVLTGSGLRRNGCCCFIEWFYQVLLTKNENKFKIIFFYKNYVTCLNTFFLLIYRYCGYNTPSIYIYYTVHEN